MLEEYYKLKIASLLHDPPYKPYLLVKHRKGHEEEARKLTNKVFGSNMVKYLSDARVRNADKIASSIDRWILSMVMGEKYIPRLFYTNEANLKNILQPSFKLSLQLGELYNEILVYDDDEDSYSNLLNGLLNKVEDWRLKYHLFYMLYETLWIDKELAVGPADTRIPTHTIFDHNYATASMVNWVIDKGGRVKGCLVGLDVANVQEFIASSRKLRDMWISSYIISALTWYSIIKIIELLGPDVVLMPSLRMNPFYLHWLEKQVKESIGDQSIINMLQDIENLVYLAKEVKEMYSDLNLPPYPIIPGRTVLILPPWDTVKNILNIETQSIEEYFRNKILRLLKKRNLLVLEAVDKV